MDDPAACFSGVTVLGNGYASALYGGKWVVVDLRRARERVLYDNYLLLLTNGSSVSQQLLSRSVSRFRKTNMRCSRRMRSISRRWVST